MIGKGLFTVSRLGSEFFFDGFFLKKLHCYSTVKFVIVFEQT